tara:strand:+ start:326 stop:481 length:156 start_codon:yes stop_codon:yes gene_type:complete
MALATGYTPCSIPSPTTRTSGTLIFSFIRCGSSLKTLPPLGLLGLISVVFS